MVVAPSPFEFCILKLSFSDSELKAESEKLSLKVLEQELDFAKGSKEARLKKLNQFGKPNTAFSWALKCNILTWFDSPDTPLQKYTCRFLKLFFFAEKIDFYWAPLSDAQVLSTIFTNFALEVSKIDVMRLKSMSILPSISETGGKRCC